MRTHRPIRRAGKVHHPRHGLTEQVEADPLRVRAGVAEGRDVGQDNVRLDVFQPIVVDAHRFHRGVGQIRHHDVCCRNQPPDYLSGLRFHRVQGHAQLVAGDLQESAAFPALGDAGHKAVFTAVHPLDANHLRAHIPQHGRAEGPGNITAEIQHSDAFQHSAHRN